MYLAIYILYIILSVYTCFFSISFPSACATASGKSYFTKQLLENCDIMYKEPVLEIQYRYHTWQPLYTEMQSSLAGKNIDFKKGVPTEQEVLTFAGTQDKPAHRIIVLDDLAQRIVNCKDMCDLFTILSHHKHISCIFIVQNLFTKGKYARDIALQYQYIVFMKSLRSAQQLGTIARQIFPKKKTDFVTAAYEDICANKKWGYILLDCAHGADDAFRLRTSIFPGELTVVYQSRS